MPLVATAPVARSIRASAILEGSIPPFTGVGAYRAKTAEESSAIAVTGPMDTLRLTQLDVGVAVAEGLGDGDALGMGKGPILRFASSRTSRIVTASPTASATNTMLASAGCNQRAVRRVSGATQAGGVAETSRPVSRQKGVRR